MDSSDLGAFWFFGGAFALWALVSLAVLAVCLVPAFFFLRNLRDLLNRVSPQNRAMPPGHVWLNFIPLFNFGWMIYTVIKVRDSVRAEYRSRGWWLDNDLGYGVGMAFAVLAVAAGALNLAPTYSLWVFTRLILVGALACFVVYWVNTNGLKNRLGGEALAPRYGYVSHPGPPSGAPSRCSACGALYAPGDGFCRSCGQRLGSSARPASATPCSACGATPDSGDAFCRSCGGDLR